MTKYVVTSANQRSWFVHLGLHHFNPSFLDRNITKKRKSWEENYVLMGQRDANSSISKTDTTMNYSFLTLQFLLLQCIQGVLYIALQRGNGGSNLSVLKEFGGPRVKLFRHILGKIQKYLSFCTHPDVHGFEVKSCIYMWVLL